MRALDELEFLQVEGEAIIRDSESFERRVEALETRMEARRQLASEAVVAVTRAEVAELRAEFESLRHRWLALGGRVPDIADLPGFPGWVARRHWAWGVATSLGAGGMLVAALAIRVHGIRLGFVEAAAQVLPVLLIAVALQGRFIQMTPQRLPVVRAYWLAFLGWIAAGEVAALVGLAMGRAAPVVVGMTGTSLAFALLTLAIVLAEAVAKARPSQPSPAARPGRKR